MCARGCSAFVLCASSLRVCLCCSLCVTCAWHTHTHMHTHIHSHSGRRDQCPSRNDPDAREVTPGARSFAVSSAVSPCQFSLPLLWHLLCIFVCYASLSAMLQHQQGCVGGHACPTWCVSGGRGSCCNRVCARTHACLHACVCARSAKGLVAMALLALLYVTIAWHLCQNLTVLCGFIFLP